MSQAAIPSRRPRRGRRVLIILLGLLFMGAGGFVLFIWLSTSALERLMAEMDRDDPGWRLEEIEAKRRVTPDERNAAIQVLAVRRVQGAQSMVVTAVIQPAFENLAPPVQLNEQQLALLVGRFTAMGQAVTEARKLKDMPTGHFPTKFTADYFSTPLDCQEVRGVAELLSWDAALRAQTLDADGALDSCLALHHTARAMGDEPRLVAVLIRYACNALFVGALERTLAQIPLTAMSEDRLKSLQKAVAEEGSEARFLAAVRGERAGVHQCFQAIKHGKAAPRILGQPSALAAQIPGMIQYQHVATLRAHNKIVAASRLNAQEADKEIETLEQNIRQESIWVRENFAALSKIKAADRRSQAWLRCAQAALAAERFRISKERWPDSLDELVGTGYLESIPTDTYDYNPLRFRRTMDGLIIYSVGPDNTDNGGLIDRDRPLVPGTDLGFQLWDVTARRQPANPPVADAELKNEK